MTKSTEELLAERGTTHGEYGEHARATQGLLRVMEGERNWPTLPDTMKETLHMIAHKIGRVITGNPNVADHWNDIAGYSKLISQRLEAPVTLFNRNELYNVIARGMNIPVDQARKIFEPLIHPRSTEAQAEKPSPVPRFASATANTDDGVNYNSQVEKDIAEELETEALSSIAQKFSPNGK